MEISISYKTTPPETTPRTSEVHDQFGIGLSSAQYEVVRKFVLDPKPGEIVFITGPSGSGKSSILRELAARTPGTLDLTEIELDDSKSVVDQFACPLGEALAFLARAGLSEAFLFLRRPSELSDGQSYRLRLALALASGAKFIAADEFAAKLDRLTARIIAHQVRAFATSANTGFFLATTHDDIAPDLRPDLLVRKGMGADVRVETRPFENAVPALLEDVTIEEGTTADWRAFSAYHYKSRHPGAVDRVFVMKMHGEPVGVAVYAYPQRQLRLRNLATCGRYTGSLTASERLRLLNREVRVLSRCVLDPRLRGLGLGARLVRETAPRLGVPFVECLAVMGGTNRFLDSAGFRRIGRCRVPRTGRELVAHLKRVCNVSDEQLHDADKLAGILQKQMETDATLRRLLATWWRAFGAVKGPITKARDSGDIGRMARTLAREATSRPFYFLLDCREAIREAS
jgi:ABC-type lipoprotein export system ATPase subunit/GNAT superfamily N-acetyltransferase